MDGPAAIATLGAWLPRIRPALEWLSRRPFSLLAVLLAANALTLPYSGLMHDARLYAFMAQNRATDGAFAGDLFLRYGSQDTLTPFSAVVAPLVKYVGLQPSFFALFLVFNTLQLAGMQRLVRALIADPAVSTLALLAMAISPLPYGGLQVFHVNEPFFSPRLVACAVSLFAMERAACRRHGAAFLLALAATIAHPLMGAGVLAIVLCAAVLERVPRSSIWLLAVGVLASVAGLLAVRPVSAAVFETMDDEWLGGVRRAAAYNFPLDWTMGEWIATVVPIAVALVAGRGALRVHPVRGRLLIVSACVAAIGLVATLIAGEASYLRLLQVQPYRISWLLKLLELPLAMGLVVGTWNARGVGAWLPRLVVAYLIMADFSLWEVTVPVALAGLFLATRERSREPADSSGVDARLAAAFLVGATAVCLVRIYVVAAHRIELLEILDPVGYVWLLMRCVSPVFWLASLCAGLAMVIERGVAAHRFIAVAVSTAAVAQALAFVPSQVGSYRDAYWPQGADRAFARRYLQQRVGLPASRLTVYDGASPDVSHVWFEFGGQSYFNLMQMVGVLFSRETAVEGMRRAAIVRPFELARYRRVGRFLSHGMHVMNRRLFVPGPGDRAPDWSDLMAICQPAEGVDLAILREDLGGASADNGHVFIYDCREVLARPRDPAVRQ